MQWIDDVEKKWHRLWSMRLMIATTIYSAAAGAWAVVPSDWQPHLPEKLRFILAGVGVALPAMAAVSRLVVQQAVTPCKPTTPEDLPK